MTVSLLLSEIRLIHILISFLFYVNFLVSETNFAPLSCTND